MYKVNARATGIKIVRAKPSANVKRRMKIPRSRGRGERIDCDRLRRVIMEDLAFLA
jgi:hypothetical protein